MNLVGYVVAAGTLLVLLPVLPFLAVVRLFDWLRGEYSPDKDKYEDSGSTRGRPPRSATLRPRSPHYGSRKQGRTETGQ